ncbi:MAG: M48 family metalloprotease [Azoarcus sp.]|jgi:putative metalloprotease|nr:M48 family metalloprotease [Azoarcus sp.]
MNRHIAVCSSLFAALLLSACLSTEGDGAAALSGAAGATQFGDGSNEARLSAATDAVRAVTVSDEELQAVTLQVVAEMDNTNQVAPDANKYAKRLNKLTRNLGNEDGLELNFKVYITDEINAFATADGSIRVYSGLMDLLNDNELRSVIGHEIGHVKLGHSLAKTRTAYLASAAAKVAVSEGGLGAEALAELGEKLINAQFSQAQESASDAYGVEFMRRHKYKLPAAESAMRKLAKLEGSSSGSKLFSSHPGAQERADEIHALITAKKK